MFNMDAENDKLTSTPPDIRKDAQKAMKNMLVYEIYLFIK